VDAMASAAKETGKILAEAFMYRHHVQTLKAKEIAASALVSIEKEFRYGTKKSTDFIDAETDLQNAELEYSTAIFNQRRAAIDLMNATNELTINKL